MGDPACWLHLLDEEGRLPDAPAEEAEAETEEAPAED